jgi:hypothetical protein
MGVVRNLAKRSLINKAKTWWVGANVKDKPQGLTLFTGGFHAYRQYTAAAAQDGYASFSFGPAKAETQPEPRFAAADPVAGV